jgi:hypothetical protein
MRGVKEHMNEEGKFDDNVVYTKGSHFIKQEQASGKEANSSGLVTKTNGINTSLYPGTSNEFDLYYA